MLKKPWDAILSAALGALALALYVLTCSPGIFPGQPAGIAVQFTGLLPRLSPLYPLWAALSKATVTLFPGDAVAALTLLSSVMAALAVALCYTAVTGLLRMLTEDARRREASSRIGGACASLALAGAIPFWVVGTRTHWAGWHVVLFMLVVNLLLAFARAPGWKLAAATGALFGLSLVEYPTMAVFLPVFGTLYFMYLWNQERVTPSLLLTPVIALGIALVAGYLLAALAFALSPGAALREYDGYGSVLAGLLREQWLLITRSLPKRGWLIVLLFTSLPWLAATMAARRGLSNERDASLVLLHMVLAAAGVSVLLDLPFSPWRQPDLGQKHILVIPYVLTAALYGYLAAYFFRLPMGWWTESESRVARWMSRNLGTGFAGVALALPVGLVYKNLPEADARWSGVVETFATEIVRSMEGREWLVSDGGLDYQIMMAAQREGASVRLLSLGSDKDLVRKSLTAGWFSDPRLKNMALVGVGPLIEEWLSIEPQAVDRLTVMAQTDVLTANGAVAIPNGAVFLAARDTAGVDVQALWDKHLQAWARLSPIVERTERASATDSMARRYCLGIRQHMARLSNNLGVLMEDKTRPELALQAYSLARAIDRENLSALLNLYSMKVRGELPTDLAATVEAEFKPLASEKAQNRYHIRSLAPTYGYVRTPQAFADLGWSWAYSGRPALAASGLTRAMGLMPEDRRSRVKQALAALYLMDLQDEKSESLFLELLEKEPNNPGALLGLCRIEIRSGDFSRAEEYLGRAEKAGIPEEGIRLERASLFLVQGEIEKARAELNRVLEANPGQMRAWAMMVVAAIQGNNAAALEDVIRRMRLVRGGNEFLLAYARGHLALIRGDADEMAAAFEEAHSLRPENQQILEILIRVDLSRGRDGSAEGRIEQVLKADPRSAFGNYAMGTLRLKRKHYDLAEDSFRRSLLTTPSAEAHNALGWLLAQTGRLPEAEAAAREALKLQPEFDNAWDTLGTIHEKAGRTAEARMAYEKAIALAPRNVAARLHLAEFLAAQGDRDEAARAVDAIEDEGTTLTDEQKEDIEALKRRLR